jgi:hypothetical protein
LALCGLKTGANKAPPPPGPRGVHCAGGWALAAMVDEVYGHVDVHDPAFDAALRTVWGENR